MPETTHERSSSPVVRFDSGIFSEFWWRYCERRHLMSFSGVAATLASWWRQNYTLYVKLLVKYWNAERKIFAHDANREYINLCALTVEFGSMVIRCALLYRIFLCAPAILTKKLKKKISARVSVSLCVSVCAKKLKNTDQKSTQRGRNMCYNA